MAIFIVNLGKLFCYPVFFLPPLVMKWVIGMRGELTLADIGLLKDSYMCVPVCDV